MIVDYSVGDTFDIKFTTRQFSDGAPTTASGLTVAAYPGNSTTEITAGITVTFTSGFDSRAGLVNVRVVATTGNGYAAGSTYYLVVTAGTVGGTSIVGEVVGGFTLGRSAAATRLGLLSATANTGDPGTTVGAIAYLKQLINVLTGTAGVATFPAEAAPGNAVSLAEVIRAIHADVTGLNGAAMRGTDGANTTTPPTAVAIRTEIDSNSTQLAAIVADTNELQTDDVPGLIAALNDVAATDIVSGGAITTSGGAVSNVTLVATTTTNTDMVAAAPTVAQIWDETKTSHVTADSFGVAIKDILVDTAEIGTAGAGLTNIGTIATCTNLTNLPAITANWLTAAGLATDAVTEISDAVLGAAVTGRSAGSLGDVVESNLNAAVGDTATAAELAKVPKSDGTTSWNATALAAINAECDTALTDYDAPTNTEMTSAFTEIKGATWATTDTLEAIRDRGDAAWTTGAGGTPPQLLQNTDIATLASQTSFTLTDGSADDDAYNGAVIVVTDSATSTQKAVGSISDYTGSTKTVTLSADPGIFTMAVGDTVDVIANASTAPSAAAVRAEIDSNSTQLAAIVADTNEIQTDWANGGRLDLILDIIAADTTTDIPGTISTLQSTADAISSAVTTVDTIVDAILVDTDSTLPALIATAQADLDIITGADGVNLLSATQTSIDAVESDTNELQTDWADGGRLDLILDAAGSAGDPWITPIPGAYDPGTAGYIVGTNIDAQVSSAGGGSPVTADEITEHRTFYGGAEGNRARNIVTLNTYASGTVTLAMDFEENEILNTDTALLSVDSATVINDDDLSSITTSNLARQKGLRSANFDVAAIATAGTFTVKTTVTTTDGQTISMTGKLVVV